MSKFSIKSIPRLDESEEDRQIKEASLERYMQKIGLQDYTPNLVLHSIYLPVLERNLLQVDDLVSTGIPLVAAATILQDMGKTRPQAIVDNTQQSARASVPRVQCDLEEIETETDFVDMPLSFEDMRAALIAERGKNQELRRLLAAESLARRLAETQIHQNHNRGSLKHEPASMPSTRVNGLSNLEAAVSSRNRKEATAAENRPSRSSSSSEEGLASHQSIVSSVFNDEQEHDPDSSSVADSAQAECRSEVSYSSHAANASDAASDLDSMHAYNYSRLPRPPLPTTVGGSLPAVVGSDHNDA